MKRRGNYRTKYDAKTRRRVCRTAMTYGVKTAVQRHGVSRPTVYHMLYAEGCDIRQSLATQRASDIDVGLAVLEVVAAGEGPMSLSAIAHVCDCSVERIRQIEEQALRKIRQNASRMRILGEGKR